METPIIERTATTSVPEHQILLSFNTDDDALAFDDWWHKEGRAMFMQSVADEENNERT